MTAWVERIRERLSEEIYRWDHETGAIRLAALTFDAFIEDWLSGALEE